ncbi:Bpu10I family restriction endonuclease, partial [Baaleninema sp.]|uniref:Bpu10I family restriction endonuclease n=1 Tax=Baaleninema sp. TaxID=3101197 RepID=UPI003D06B096
TPSVRKVRPYAERRDDGNLDKTMFQEACATASDVRRAVSGAKYFLLCEWLDMTPLSTVPTDIEEVLILRKAKRLGSHRRKLFSSAKQRRLKRGEFEAFLQENPFRVEMFDRFRGHIRKLLANEVPLERDVLEMGYF